MKEHYVSYDCAVKLKELGFDEPTSHYYCAFDNETDVRFWDVHPKQSQNAFRSPKDKVIADALRLDQAAAWLRDCKGIDIDIPPILKVCPEKAKTYNLYLCYFSKTKVGYMNNYDRIGEGYSTYELALSAGIDAALELLTNKQTDKWKLK